MDKPYTGLEKQYFETSFLYECIEELKKKALLASAGLYEMTPIDKLAYTFLKNGTTLDWTRTK